MDGLMAWVNNHTGLTGVDRRPRAWAALAPGRARGGPELTTQEYRDATDPSTLNGRPSSTRQGRHRFAPDTEQSTSTTS
jgi:hypothetical protein